MHSEPHQRQLIEVGRLWFGKGPRNCSSSQHNGSLNYTDDGGLEIANNTLDDLQLLLLSLYFQIGLLLLNLLI